MPLDGISVRLGQELTTELKDAEWIVSVSRTGLIYICNCVNPA